MPWVPTDAPKHTKAADTEKKKRRWAKIANGVLQKTGDEAKAIRIANASIHRMI